MSERHPESCECTRCAGFTPGHEVSERHGAYSQRRIGPRAVEIEQVARSSPGWPSYLGAPEFAASVSAWARSEAVCDLLTEYLTDRDIGEALSELSTSSEDETRSKGRARRVSSSRRTMSALEMLRRFESIAMHHRDRLGLSPLARSRMSKDIASARLDLAQVWAKQDREELSGTES